MPEHLTENVIARGNITGPDPAEAGGTGEPDLLLLYLDADEVYRWYHEDGTSSDLSAPDIQSAFAAARLKWPDFELVEYRDRLVEAGDESKIVNVHAADEKQRRAEE